VLNSILSARSIMGLTQNTMRSACFSITDHGPDLQVKLMGWMALAPTSVAMRYTAGVDICI
jgi:hypothetical protein